MFYWQFDQLYVSLLNKKYYFFKRKNSTTDHKLLRGSVLTTISKMSCCLVFFHTVPLPAPEALKILDEQDHVFLFWKSLAVKDRTFNESRVRNQTHL